MNTELNRLAERLIQTLERSADCLHGLHRAMESNRTAWLALRPKELEDAVRDMSGFAERNRALDRERDGLLEELRGRLQLSGDITITGLQRHLVGNRLNSVTRSIGAETRLGERLLQNSQRAQVGAFQTQGDDATGAAAVRYTREAKATSNAAPSGTLVNGTL